MESCPKTADPLSTALLAPGLAIQHPAVASMLSEDGSTIDSSWDLCYRVTIVDAIELGLLDVINRIRGIHTTQAEFVTGLQSCAGSDLQVKGAMHVQVHRRLASEREGRYVPRCLCSLPWVRSASRQ